MIFASALFFYMASATIRWSKSYGDISSANFVFNRFLLGFIVVAGSMLIKKKLPKVKSHHLLWGRLLTNCIAVFCFYTAIDKTSAANANILNMTYPIFIALISWFLFKHERDGISMIIAMVSFAGVGLILSRNGLSLDTNNFWGIASGLSASISIIYLNLARKEHDTDTILLYMFGFGALIILSIFYKTITWPDPVEFKYLILCSFFGIAGQYSLTLGHKFVTAVESGIISSTRILMAALLGPVITGDLPLSIYGWSGGLLIFSSNVILTIRKIKDKKE